MKQQKCQNCIYWDGRQFRVRVNKVLTQKNGSITLTKPIPMLIPSARCKEIEQVLEVTKFFDDEEYHLPEIETPRYFGCNQWVSMVPGVRKPPKSERNIRSRW